MAFVLMGILKKFELSNKKLAIVAVVLSLIGTFLKGIDFGVQPLNLFFAHFIGAKGGFGAFLYSIGSFSQLQDAFGDNTSSGLRIKVNSLSFGQF